MATVRINPFKLFVGAFIPNWLAARTEISPGSKICYAELCRHAGNGGVAWPSLETLGREMGTTERQVRRYIDELEREGLIESERQGLRRCNRYYFLDHKWLVSDRTDMSTQDRTNTSTLDRTQMSAPSVRESKKREKKDQRDELSTPPEERRKNVALLRDVIEGISKRRAGVRQ